MRCAISKSQRRLAQNPRSKIKPTFGEICKESAKNPPVNDCTHTPSRYTRPIIPTKSQIARLQNGGAAVNGLWPPAIESARGRWPTSVFTCVVGCLSVLPLLHSPFLHSSFALFLCSHPFWYPFFGSLKLLFLKFSFSSVKLTPLPPGATAHSAGDPPDKILDALFSNIFSHRFLERFWEDFGSLFGSIFLHFFEDFPKM